MAVFSNFIAAEPVQDWLQSLLDCPPSMARHGYGLLDAWWSMSRCDHVLCRSANGCTLDYPTSCREVSDALEELVRRKLISPWGYSDPVLGHTHKASGPDISSIRRGVPWDQRIHEPAYIYWFESGDNLCGFLEGDGAT